MSTAVYPTLATLGFSVFKKPEFSTIVQRAASGREIRAALWSYPIWEIRLTYEALRDDVANNEFKQLLGFFLLRQGSFDTFYFNDPDDNSVVDQVFGIGDGTTTQFQLIRSYASFIEPVYAVNTITNVKKAGATQTNPTNYTINSTGLITFVSPPAAAASLTATFTYYYRARFKDDLAEFEKFMQQLWTAKTVAMVSVK